MIDHSILGSILLWSKGIPNLSSFYLPEELIVFDMETYVNALWFEPLLIKTLGRDFVKLLEYKKFGEHKEEITGWMFTDLSSSLMTMKQKMDYDNNVPHLTASEKVIQCKSVLFLRAGEDPNVVTKEISHINNKIKETVEASESTDPFYIMLVKKLKLSGLMRLKDQSDEYLEDNMIAQAIRLQRGEVNG